MFLSEELRSLNNRLESTESRLRQTQKELKQVESQLVTKNEDIVMSEVSTVTVEKPSQPSIDSPSTSETSRTFIVSTVL